MVGGVSARTFLSFIQHKLSFGKLSLEMHLSVMSLPLAPVRVLTPRAQTFLGLWYSRSFFPFFVAVVEPNVVPKKCDPLNTDMCKDLGYTFVQMPNFFKDETQNEAKLRIKEFYPLVQTKCSSALRFFLCTLYIPPCVINVNEMIHPCREVCEEARRGCEPIMLRAGFHWPDVMKCSRPDFPLNRSGFCLKPNPQNPKGEVHTVHF